MFAPWKSTTMSLSMPVVTEMALPFTKELVRLGGAAYGVKWLMGYGADYDTKAVVLSVVVELVSLCAIVHNTLSLSPCTQGGSRLVGTLAGASSALFAIVLPRLVMPSVLETFCDSCPSAGRLSIGFVLLLIFASLDAFVRHMLTSIDARAVDKPEPEPATKQDKKAE